MNSDDIKICCESYQRLKNLKLVEKETGFKWQTVYVALKKEGIPVCGDKKRYGSTTDKLARKFEERFLEAVPFAKDNNLSQWQSTVDFYVGNVSIDVKVSKISNGGRQKSGKSFSAKWGFCISKQKDKADFFVLYALDADENVKHVFLIPKEIAVTKTTISIPGSLVSKWSEFEIDESELAEFFYNYANDN